jgi:putative DNA primase/helicase
LIPFRFTFKDNPQGPNERKRDPHLLTKLKAEASGILAWLVRGCLEWQAQGLNPPEIITNATREYRHEEDQLGRFLDDSCTFGPHIEAQSSKLFEAYKLWCESQGERAMSGRAFGEDMMKRFDSYEKRHVRFYLGLGLACQM